MEVLPVVPVGFQHGYAPGRMSVLQNYNRMLNEYEKGARPISSGD